MVPGGRESLRHILEKVFAIVTHGGCFAVHQFICPNNFTTKCLSNGLVAQAYAKEWYLSCPSFDCLQADTRTVGIAGTGRNDQSVKAVQLQIIDTYCIITDHFLLRSQLSKILDNVVGEGIVVIDDEEAHLAMIKLYGVSLLAGTLFEAESMESDKATSIFGGIITFIIIHRGNFHIIKGLFGLASNRCNISFIKF